MLSKALLLPNSQEVAMVSSRPMSGKRSRPAVPIFIPQDAIPGSDKEAIALSLLYAWTASRKKNRAGYWINIHSKELEKKLGREYRHIMEGLQTRGIIEINDRYSTGRFTKSYRLADAYRTHRFREFNRENNQQLPSQVRLDDSDRVGWGLVKMMQKVSLPPDCKFKGWNGVIEEQVRNHRFYATRCQYGRFHTSFTGLNKKARRQLITEQGHKLIEVDVSHCQPLIMAAMIHSIISQLITSQLITSQLNTSQLNTSQLNTSQHATSQPPISQLYTPHPNTPHPIPIPICSAFDDFGRYTELCESGTLYEHIAKLCGDVGLTLRDCYQPGDWKPHWENGAVKVKHAKKAFLVMTFCENDMMRLNPVFGVVQGAFPSVAEFMLESKRECYQELARNCQRSEARLMIDGVCADIIDNHPEVTILTVHDAILTPIHHAEIVEDAIRRQFRKLGLKPFLKRGNVDQQPHSV